MKKELDQFATKRHTTSEDLNAVEDKLKSLKTLHHQRVEVRRIQKREQRTAEKRAQVEQNTNLNTAADARRISRNGESDTGEGQGRPGAQSTPLLPRLPGLGGSGNESSSHRSNTRSFMSGMSGISGEWAALAQYNVLQEKERQQREESLHKEQQRQLKMTLDKQVEERRRMRRLEKERVMEYGNLALEEQRAFREDEKAREERQRAQIQREYMQSALEVRDFHQKRKEEAARKLEEEQTFLQRMRAEQDRANADEQQKKADRALEYQRVMRENEDHLRRKEEEKQREREEAVRLQKFYIATLDEQDRKRQQEEEKRAARQKAIQRIIGQAVANEKAEMQARLEANAEKYQRERDVAQAKEERERKQRRLKDRDEMLHILQSQIHVKEQAVQQAKDEQKVFQKQMQQEAERVQADAKSEKKVKKEKMRWYSEQLNSQLREKKAHSHNANEMTETERKFNADLINQIAF
jgi:hypothetical protein